MPRRRRLTDAQLDQLLALPTQEADIIRYYTLSEADITLIQRRRRPQNRLGFALQLCGLRYPGRLLRRGEVVPEAMLSFVAHQLDILPEDIEGYADRLQTRYEQLDALRKLFGFRVMSQPDRAALQSWLAPVALGTVKPEIVGYALMEEVRARSLAMPGSSVIEVMVSMALHQAEVKVNETLTNALSDKQRRALDSLLVTRTGEKESRLSWVRQFPGALNTRSFSRILEQLDFLRGVGLASDFGAGVHPDRLKQLAREGSRLSTQHFGRLSAARRRATLVATVLDLTPRLTDEAISTFERLMGRIFKRAERRASEALQKDARALNEKVKLLARIGNALIAAKGAETDPFGAIEAVMPWAEFEKAVTEADGLVRTEGTNYASLAESNHALLRRIGPPLLSHFTFEGVGAVNDLLATVATMREFYAGSRKALPKGASTRFMRPAWRTAVLRQGEIDLRAYELCVLVELRDKLRSADIWVVGSRQYRAVEDQLLSRQLFKEIGQAGPLPIPAPRSATSFLEERMVLLSRRIKEVASKAEDDALDDVRVLSASLKITPLDAVTSEPAEVLGARLYGMLPRVKITDLLEEVAHWSGFTDCFTHLKHGAKPDNARILLTAILAEATNLGFTRMADACSAASYTQLVWATGWHVREETHAAALRAIITLQQAHPLAALFGDGSSSSSDGQHFPLGGRAEVAGTINPHKGSSPAISIYTHLSARFAPFSSRTISATEGEAPYVLDGLIEAGVNSGLRTHHTDGGGVSDHVFALCSLLGFRFAPRIPNLKDRRLYTFGPAAEAGCLEPFVGGRIDQNRVMSHWDDVLRLATSVRLGHVPASLILKRLGAYPRQNGLALALREIGRIERTLFTLDWLEDPQLRRKTSLVLNKGESRNSLARAVCFHRLGRFRDHTHEGRQYRASSLNLVVAAIILWNTMYLGRAVDTLRAAGEAIDDDLLAHVAPLGWQHINLTGDYLWPTQPLTEKSAWRPLRKTPMPLLAA